MHVMGGLGDVGGWVDPAMKKKPVNQTFLENDNNSKISSIDFLQTPVSTGLGLSLNYRRVAGPSTMESPPFSVFGDEIELEIQRQDAQLSCFLQHQGQKLKQSILENVQTKQLETLAMIEEKIHRKLRGKEAEIEDIKKRNMELEEQIRHLSTELDSWQNHAKYNENMVMALKFSLQKLYVQNSGGDGEGYGEREVDDTASCSNRGAVDFHLTQQVSENFSEARCCKVCRVNEVCMLLLPCRHLCLCKGCESKLNICPLCHSSKLFSVEIFM